LNRTSSKFALITGGAGFIGANMAHRLASNGTRVVIFDNLSRAGVERNLEWLQEAHGSLIAFERGDCRKASDLEPLIREAGQVFHFAAQVAVTTSLLDPVQDFEINAVGTLNVLEALRKLEHRPPLVFTSTNKVYGDLADIALCRSGLRYEPRDAALAAKGVDETQSLDFHSPYGCSKGGSDQYVLDYARNFGLPAVVLRMSCIYGPFQHGSEDQGWVAHFLRRALAGEPITVYGDGFQVRDVLFIDDLVEALLLARDHAVPLAGQAFNMGGGPANATSLLELVERISVLIGRLPEVRFEPPRKGDQRYYVSNTGRFARATGFLPRVLIHDGLSRLHQWLTRSALGARAGAHGNLSNAQVAS
jgi:CDP-paratose 2-epimerase